MSLLKSMIRRMWRVPVGPQRATNFPSTPKPTISADYATLNRRLHVERPDYGSEGRAWAKPVLALARAVGAVDVLDYGCGKQSLAARLASSGLQIRGYDPAVAGLDGRPEPADVVVCTDVLEHVEPQYVDNVLDDLARCTRRAALITVATQPAVKTLADGRNAHLTVQPLEWWRERIVSRFDLIECRESEDTQFVMLLTARGVPLRVKTASSTPADLPRTAAGEMPDGSR